MTTTRPSIRIEFFGIPRARAEVAATHVALQGETTTLGQVLEVLAERFPALAAECISGSTLRDGYAASVGGERFVRRSDEVLRAGDSLIILTADAGG